MSNAELIGVLAATIDIKPRTVILIRGQIVFCDSTSGSTLGILELCNGLISHGRLGRDHIFANVPNQYIRDYLNTTELEQYSALIAKGVEENKPKTQDEMIARIVGTKPLRTESEVECVLNLAYAVDQPGLKKMTPEESGLNVGIDINKDCDQIRTMIVCSVDGKQWTADQFRWVLGDFFKKREILGPPLTGMSGDTIIILQERDGNVANKCQSTDGDGSSSKRRRTRRA
ncbi:hypothetical protein F4814DRAFT_438457 [Daldinia grandis]|nr:hypothetical protein F4814DRAFT_438457 [Daldinia grandis]